MINFLLVKFLSILKEKRTATECHKNFRVKKLDQRSPNHCSANPCFFPKKNLVKGSAKNRSINTKKIFKNPQKIPNIPRNIRRNFGSVIGDIGVSSELFTNFLLAYLACNSLDGKAFLGEGKNDFRGCHMEEGLEKHGSRQTPDTSFY